MPWDGGGKFTREHDWTDDANANIDIEASRMDAEDDNFATGIEACLNKDGQNTAEQLNVDNIRIDGNDITSQDTDGDINLTPNGTGSTVIKNLSIQGATGTSSAEVLQLHACSQSTGTDDWTRICRIVFDAQAEYTNMVLRVLDGIESTADNDACELIIRARQEAALGSAPGGNPAVTLRVRNLDGAGSIDHTSFAAYYSTVSATQSVIDVYVTSASGDLDAFYQALTINNNGGEVTFYDSDGTDTEANITGGTFDVVSRPAEGELEKHQYEASRLDAAGEVTRLCRVTLPNDSTTDSIGFRLLLHDVARNAATPQDDWEAVVSCRQNAAFGSDPEVSIATRALTTPIGLTHDKIHAYVADNSGPTLIDFYIEHENSLIDWVFRVADIALGDTDARIELFNADGVSDEATVTGGSWDVTSQAARGEVVAEESFSIGGDFSDTGHARSVRGNGGNWVTVFVPSMSHTSNSAPVSGTGDLPSAYRPSSGAQPAYSYTGNSAIIHSVEIIFNGTIEYDYRAISDGSLAGTVSNTRNSLSITYFVAD